MSLGLVGKHAIQNRPHRIGRSELSVSFGTAIAVPGLQALFVATWPTFLQALAVITEEWW